MEVLFLETQDFCALLPQTFLLMAMATFLDGNFASGLYFLKNLLLSLQFVA